MKKLPRRNYHEYFVSLFREVYTDAGSSVISLYLRAIYRWFISFTLNFIQDVMTVS
jgi:hypothetical protein